MGFENGPRDHSSRSTVPRIGEADHREWAPGTWLPLNHTEKGTQGYSQWVPHLRQDSPRGQAATESLVEAICIQAE